MISQKDSVEMYFAFSCIGWILWLWLYCQLGRILQARRVIFIERLIRMEIFVGRKIHRLNNIVILIFIIRLLIIYNIEFAFNFVLIQFKLCLIICHAILLDQAVQLIRRLIIMVIQILHYRLTEVIFLVILLQQKLIVYAYHLKTH